MKKIINQKSDFASSIKNNSILNNNNNQCSSQIPHHNCGVMNLAMHLKCAAFSKLVSNSSSLDEGVESDLSSPTSISFSNDFLSSSVTSCHSIQLSSFDSGQSQHTNHHNHNLNYRLQNQQQNLYQSSFNSGFNCMDQNLNQKKFSLPGGSLALNKKHKLSNLKKNLIHNHQHKSLCSNTRLKSNNCNNDIAQIRQELHSLIKSSNSSCNSSLNTKEGSNNSLALNISNQTESESTGNSVDRAQASPNTPHHQQKYKQFIFFRYSKKKVEHSNSNNVPVEMDTSNNSTKTDSTNFDNEAYKKSQIMQESDDVPATPQTTTTTTTTTPSSTTKMNILKLKRNLFRQKSSSLNSLTSENYLKKKNNNSNNNNNNNNNNQMTINLNTSNLINSITSTTTNIILNSILLNNHKSNTGSANSNHHYHLSKLNLKFYRKYSLKN